MTAWIDQLEEAVERASARLRELEKRNRELETRLAALARQAEEKGAEADGWEEEKEEIRRRVARLAEGLESLLEE